MALPLGVLRGIQSESDGEAWRAVIEHAWATCSRPLTPAQAVADVTRRDRDLASLDLVLATGAGDLWVAFESTVERTSRALAEWWVGQPPGRAVLILDGLSLRETPWLIGEAERRGYRVVGARATAAELPAETQPFAMALGFAQRSSLANDGAGQGHCFKGARTDSVSLPWADCLGLVGAERDWVLWHHWPDDRLHDLAAAGQGLSVLTAECTKSLTDDAFWALIGRLTTGRRLVITSDHGYAATGHFHDSPEAQAKYLKGLFASGRSAAASDDPAPWLPSVDLTLTSAHGAHRYALGRRKWKSQGGYPTLTHGGLSVLEVLSPFIELARAG